MGIRSATGALWLRADPKVRLVLKWCRRRKVLYWLLGLFAIAGALWLDQTSPPPAKPSGFWGVLFANSLVFAVTRVAIISAGAYVVYSVLHNVSQGLPLKQMAGARVADRVSEDMAALRRSNENVTADRDHYMQLAEEATEEVDRLQGLLESAVRAIDALNLQLNPPLPGVDGGTLSFGGQGDD